MNSPSLFGEWLRQSRDGLGLTRKEFASRVGCSVSTLRKIEDGERRPSGQVAELIANCLNIPPTDRSTFIRVARGDLSVDRLPSRSKPVSVRDVPSTSTASTPPVNLPVFPTPLIGRERELRELDQLLRDPQCRLLTLVGPGGIGKTRLAVEAASRSKSAFADGIYFAPLAPVDSARFIVPVIADALGFSFGGGSRIDPKAQLFSYLKEKQALLLTDNLEHLLGEAGIEVLAELLANAPRVKVLSTSRESLRLQGEWVSEVHGLPIPDAGQPDEGTQDTSVELFLQRARRAHVGFNAAPEDYPAILRICQLVEGMPLAIELAAAWVPTLPCAEIAREIERGLDFLSISARDVPARHRSMRAVFAHSWRLVTAEEQGVLFRLSVFRGGFQREAAEQVADATLSMLSSLVAKSLIRRSGAGRYSLHDLIRQFAAEHATDRVEEQTATEARHGSYYLTSFCQADGRLRSSMQREALIELTAEMDNFRAAWDWAVAHGEFGLIEQTLRIFTMLHDTRGWLQEGLDYLDRAIHSLETVRGQSLPDRTKKIALGHLLVSRSLLASRLGQYEEAQATLERSLTILRPLNEPRVLVEAVTFLGMALELTGNYDRAADLYLEGLNIARDIGDQWFAALCLIAHTGLISITLPSVRPEQAHDLWQSAVADWRAIGDPRMTAMTLNLLSWNALILGRFDEARAATEESISLGISVGDRYALGFAYRGLGLIAQTQGEHSQAVETFRKSLETLTELGARQDAARVLAEMSRSVIALGNDAEAEGMLHESLSLANETQGTFIELDALVGIASLQAKQGNAEHALKVLLIVLNHSASLPETRNRAEQLHAELEAKLTRQQVEAVQTRAQSATLEAIVAQML